MDVEIETHHHEAMVPSHVLAKLGDALPAFGIVAAVMGVVHYHGVGRTTTRRIGRADRRSIGRHLSGYPGWLMASSGPLATLLNKKAEESGKMFQTVKVTLLANLNGYAPAMAVEFGRKVLNSTERPSFIELEEHVKQKR